MLLFEVAGILLGDDETSDPGEDQPMEMGDDEADELGEYEKFIFDLFGRSRWQEVMWVSYRRVSTHEYTVVENCCC